MSNDCKFCGDLWNFNAVIEATRPDFKFKYSVCLVEELIRDGQVRSTTTWKKRKLNYCPSCGKKLG